MTAPAAVRARPILFSGPMVRAILDGPKTQTRRVVRPQVLNDPRPMMLARKKAWEGSQYQNAWVPEAYGDVGERLWVRETFWRDERDSGVVIYDATPEWGKYRTGDRLVRASFPDSDRISRQEWPTREHMAKEMETNRFWSRRSSRFMPRWACRLVLELTDVRVERLQTISEADIGAEGVEPCLDCDKLISYHHEGRPHWWREDYAELWDSLNAKRGYGWDVNPWVWVLSFRRVEP